MICDMRLCDRCVCLYHLVGKLAQFFILFSLLDVIGAVHTGQNKGHVRLSPLKKRMKILFRTGFPKASQDQLSGLEMTFTPPRESGK